MLLILSRAALASTVITNTRPDIAQMAGLWEADSVQISSLANTQYPAYSPNTWEYISPHTSQAADGDLHIDMAIDASGTGANGNNFGNSPIIGEIILVTQSQLNHVVGLNNHAKTRGIFRFYTEHAGERHYELHPMTELYTWNGSAFVLDAGYRANFTFVPDGTGKAISTYQTMVDSSQGVSATMMADNNRVILTYPTGAGGDTANYVQYVGKVVTPLTNDFVGQYFTFLPTNSPAGVVTSARTIRCRIVTNTTAATAAAALVSNQAVTVNALARIDMLGVSNAIWGLSANQSTSFVRPVEFVALGVSSTAVPTLPVISNVRASNVTETAATVQWATDVPSDSRVIYGVSPSSVTNVVSSAGTVTSHSVNLTGLLSSTIYYFNVSSANAAGTNTDDNAEEHYTFITAGPFDLPLTPAAGFTSTGIQGGPFAPTSQVYSLSNTNATSANWGVTKSAIWLDVVPTNGLLAAGGSTNITVYITANANLQDVGNYSDFVVFRNLSSGSLTSRVVSLLAFPPATLAVTPATAFNSAGPPGGPFTPSAANYTVTNIGSNTLNWAASTAAAWLDLSAAGGTLAPGASWTVTVTINTNANALAGGSYDDSVTFTNLSNSLGTTTRAVTLNASSFGFYDDYSTFTVGNLVGQQGWTQIGVTSSLPLQVTAGGKVAYPGAQLSVNQSAYKDFALTNITVYYGASITVTSVPPGTTSPSPITALNISNSASSFNNYRFSANKFDATHTNFIFVLRITGQSQDPFTGSTGPQYGMSFGSQHRVIIRADAGGSNAVVYVDPTSSDPTAQTPYLTHAIGAGAAPPPSVGSFIIQQNESIRTTNTFSDGALIGKIVVADNFATVYNDLLDALPPVAAFTASPNSGTEPLNVTFSDSSSGTITNRAWDFGDGSSTNITTNTVSHTYAAGGYTVRLVVSGPGGASTNTQPNYVTALTAFQSWLIQYFGNTNNPTGDPDGDGFSNTQEFLAGSDPTNSASAFRILSITTESNDVRVTWKTAGGRTNAVQDAPIVSGSYTDVSPNILIPGVGDAITNYLNVGGATNVPAHFYRIRLVP